MKILGAGFISIGCWAIGYYKCRFIRQEQSDFSQLLIALDWMICLLEYHLPPISQLLSQASQQCTGCVRNVLLECALLLEAQNLQPSESMQIILQEETKLSPRIKEQLSKLGQSLGTFDLQGQCEELESAKLRCQKAMEESLRQNEKCMQVYQTLPLCAGIALVILLL